MKPFCFWRNNALEAHAGQTEPAEPEPEVESQSESASLKLKEQLQHFQKKVGSRAEVAHGVAEMTVGGLT